MLNLREIDVSCQLFESVSDSYTRLSARIKGCGIKSFTTFTGGRVVIEVRP